MNKRIDKKHDMYGPIRGQYRYVRCVERRIRRALMNSYWRTRVGGLGGDVIEKTKRLLRQRGKSEDFIVMHLCEFSKYDGIIHISRLLAPVFQVLQDE